MKTKNKFMILIVSFFFWAAHTNVMAVTTFLYDNFDSENGGAGTANYTGFANWNVTIGGVDLSGNGVWDWLPGNGLYIDLDGSTDDAGKLESKTNFNLYPGSYELSFDLAGSQRGETNSVMISLGSVYNETFTLVSDIPFTTITRDFSVATLTNGTLNFEHIGIVDWSGLLIDNVRFSMMDSSPIPEPSSILLLGFGVAGLAVWRKRFR